MRTLDLMSEIFKNSLLTISGGGETIPDMQSGNL